MKIDSLRISHSSRSMFASCPRKLEFRKFYNYSKREESLATLAGSALHAAYQQFLVDGNRENAILTLMLELPTKYDVAPLQPRSIEACYSTLLAMMDYRNYRGYELATVVANGIEQPAIEVPFRIRFKNFSLSDTEIVPVDYIGYIDLILFDPIEQKFIVTDIKTTTRDIGDMTPVYKFDDQCLPYALVLEAIMGKPLTQLDVQYMSCIVSLDNPTVVNYQFTKDQSDIEDWTRGMALDLQLMKMYYQNGWFPRRASACTAFNRTCQFFDFCGSRSEKTIEHMLSFETRQEEQLFEPWIDIELNIDTGE